MNSQARSLSHQEIIEFAQAFDPQPYHLDSAAGDASIFGGLCASGWQVAALATQLVTEALTAEGVCPVNARRDHQARSGHADRRAELDLAQANLCRSVNIHRYYTGG